MEKSIKEEIIKSAENIKKKIKKMNDDKDENHMNISNVFQPIIEPLNSIVKNDNKNCTDWKNTTRHVYTPDINLSDQTEKGKSSMTSETSFYSDVESGDDNKDRLDANSEHNDDSYTSKVINSILVTKKRKVPYGVRKCGSNFMIGNQNIEFFPLEHNKLGFRLANNQFTLTDGLKELLFAKSPIKHLITKNDKDNYRTILVQTNAHKRNFNSRDQIQGGKGAKYKNIIRPMFYTTTSTPKEGGCLPKLKQFKSNTDLVYWDDPNELVDRLRLLIAAKRAGNSGNDNEIISIIEELKEAKLIK